MRHHFSPRPSQLKLILITHFRLSRKLISDVNSLLVLLNRVDVGDVADVSEVHAASMNEWMNVCMMAGP
jgi:hypothetical protein